MSSTYYVLCMSHDPAMVISSVDRDFAKEALIELRGQEHKNCDLLAVRVSGAPVEFGCLGIDNDQCYGHSRIKWLDADVIRLLIYTEGDTRDEMRVLKDRHTFQCWTKQRLHRLRFEAGVAVMNEERE